jgi:hypothetical protein
MMYIINSLKQLFASDAKTNQEIDQLVQQNPTVLSCLAHLD